MEIANAAKSYFTSRCEAQVDIFLIETKAKSLSFLSILPLPSTTPITSLTDEERSILSSPFLRPPTSKLSAVLASEATGLLSKLQKAYTNGKIITPNDYDDGAYFIPILDKDDAIPAIMRITIDKTLPDANERVMELEKISHLLGNILTEARLEPFDYKAKNDIHLGNTYTSKYYNRSKICCFVLIDLNNALCIRNQMWTTWTKTLVDGSNSAKQY